MQVKQKYVSQISRRKKNGGVITCIMYKLLLFSVDFWATFDLMKHTPLLFLPAFHGHLASKHSIFSLEGTYRYRHHHQQGHNKPPLKKQGSCWFQIKRPVPLKVYLEHGDNIISSQNRIVSQVQETKVHITMAHTILGGWSRLVLFDSCAVFLVDG